MNIKDNMIQTLNDMESIVKLFNIEPFDIYFLGGAACVLGGYTNNATQDFDFIDLNYDSHMGKVFAILRDYDMLEYESTILAADYRDRAKKMDKYIYFNAYVLAPEDIVVSKIIRLGKKDIQDIDELITQCDKHLINNIINNVLKRTDLYDTKKQGFLNNLEIFRERYNV
jgi:hypothetical protein